MDYTSNSYSSFSATSIFSAFYVYPTGVPAFDKTSFHSQHKLRLNYSNLKYAEFSLCRHLHDCISLKKGKARYSMSVHNKSMLAPVPNPIDFNRSDPKTLRYLTDFFQLVWLIDIFNCLET